MTPSRRAPTPAFQVERDGPVATVTLCRPPARDGWEALSALAGLGRDLPGDVRVVVVRCEDVFSAGARDLLALANSTAAEIESQLAGAQEAVAWLRRPDLLTVAAVPGRASGVSLAAALACDQRILAEGAELAVSDLTGGVLGCLGITRRLVELAGYPVALDWCLAGRSVTAREAYSRGLANRIVPLAELDPAVAALVATIVRADRDTVIETKALLDAALIRTASEQEEAERAAIARLLGVGE